MDEAPPSGFSEGYAMMRIYTIAHGCRLVKQNRCDDDKGTRSVSGNPNSSDAVIASLPASCIVLLT